MDNYYKTFQKGLLPIFVSLGIFILIKILILVLTCIKVYSVG